MAALSDRQIRLVEALVALEEWGTARRWAGPDPYDGLNAARLVAPLRRSSRGRQLITQMVKRSPLDLRPLLGIRPERSSAAIAQVASSYARGGNVFPEARSKLEEMVALLEGLRCPGFEEPCWGYHFDVQTRVFFYPRSEPNTIATSFAGLAILDAYEVTGDARLLQLAAGVGDFFLRHVPQTVDNGGAFFGYLVGDRTPIHNANMLVSALLARLARHVDRSDFLDATRAGIAYTVSRQRADGSWPYGELPHLTWVDAFHTGYVLESLILCEAAGVVEPASAALDRGLNYYGSRLFLADGTPKYTPTSVYPIDSQCVAQGIQTFARAATLKPQLREMAWTVFRYAMTRMRRSDGAFIFQRRRAWQNRTPHIRWAEAPMLLALTHLLELSDASVLE